MTMNTMVVAGGGCQACFVSNEVFCGSLRVFYVGDGGESTIGDLVCNGHQK